MNIVFDSTITLGQFVHVAILIFAVWLMHRKAQRRIKNVELKLDRLLDHAGLTPTKERRPCKLNGPSPSATL